jgi:hypothetical protein
VEHGLPVGVTAEADDEAQENCPQPSRNEATATPSRVKASRLQCAAGRLPS